MLLSAEMIPVHPAARRSAADAAEALRLAVGGGEDYELCFTAPQGRVLAHVLDFEREFGVPLACVGRVGGGEGVWWVDAEGHRSPLGVEAFQHFAEGA
ncbi:MAG TPA: hypothetical protein VHG51_06300 [Longimicrobiaceae bacterium]|nr:hypothetical protein [Longimicrobiaceae bacterium]